MAIAARSSLGSCLFAGLLASCSFSSFLSASWLATGPFGGDADIVRAIPGSKGHIIAAARNGLIFSSTNGGASWTNLPFPAQFAGVLHALEVDPKAPGTWYAGVEGDIARNSGVYKTMDGGATWSLLPGSNGIPVWSLAIWPGDSSVIAAGSGTGVYLTRDAGASWKLISPQDDAELRPVVSLAFHPADNRILYAGTTHLPWRTGDGGATWQSIHTGMIDDSDVFSIQVDQLHPEHVMASACSGVYNSPDSAGHWTKLETPKGAFRTHFVALDPRHEGIVFAGTTEGLLRSENGGKTWRVVSAYSIRSIAFDPLVEGRVFFAASSGGPMVSNDEGVTLRESNIGFTNRNFTTLAGAGMSLYSGSVYEAGAGGMYRTENLAARWTRAAGPAGDELVQVAVSPDNPKRIYAAGYHGFFESRDGGNTWSVKKTPSGSAPVTSLMPLPDGVVLAGTASGLFRAAEGESWTSVAAGAVQSMQVSAGSVISAVTRDGAVVSRDAGLTWKPCAGVNNVSAWYGLAFDSTTALAATSDGLYRSVDGCQTWTAVHDGLGPQTVSLVLFHPVNRGEAIASQGGRILISTDGGRNWEPIDDGPGSNSGPASLLVLPSVPDRLFALFPRRGVYSTGIGFWASTGAGGSAAVASGQ